MSHRKGGEKGFLLFNSKSRMQANLFLKRRAQRRVGAAPPHSFHVRAARLIFVGIVKTNPLVFNPPAVSSRVRRFAGNGSGASAAASSAPRDVL